MKCANWNTSVIGSFGPNAEPNSTREGSRSLYESH
jgi:hypothetical protein